MHPQAKSAQDRRVALGWIGRQLAWETRLQALRDPDEVPVPEQQDADEVDSAA